MARQNPFSDLYFALNFASETPAPNDLNRARVAVISSPFTAVAGNANGSGGGITGAGLYAILRAGVNSNNSEVLAAIPVPNVPADPTNIGLYYDVDSQIFIMRSAQSLIGALNVINNNINTIIRSFLPTAPSSASSGYRRDPSLSTDYVYVTLAGNNSINAFLFMRDFLFPGSYTGNTAGVLPKTDSLTPPTEDLLGNGITGAFFVYDAVSGATPLSRTGIELLTCLELLQYGAVVHLLPSYDQLNTASYQVSAERNIPFDAVVMLEQQSLMEGRASSNSDDYGIYGNLNYTYASGNTFNFCHGVSAAQFGNTYFNLINRNNALNSEIIGVNSSEFDSAVYIHCGLSGFNVANEQRSVNGSYTDIYRYPGFDGLSGSYQNVVDVAGNTSYRLSATDLTRTFCVIGKKTRFVTESNGSFGNPDNAYELDITTPLTIDVAGAITRAKRDQTLYGGIAGLNYGSILNGGQYSFTLSPSASPTITQMLKQRRVNYFVRSQQGVYLGTDYIGATGSYTSTNRYGVASLQSAIQQQVSNLLTPIYVNTAAQNVAATRSAVVNAVYNAFNSNAAFTQIKNSILPIDIADIQCDSQNNSDYSNTLNVKITVYPRIVATGTDTIIGGLTVNVVVGASQGV